ncbi:putative major facilitator superfamily transporter [Fonsecaea pedrosoi]|nr:putative major facilitator superfamily transporter [Fonsecaea pedrosoi]
MEEKLSKQASEVGTMEQQLETTTKDKDGEHEHNVVIKGDDSDGKLDWSVRAFVAYLSLCFVYTGSQMPLYFCAGGTSYIIEDIGGSTTSSWLPVAYTLSAAIPIPFTGYLQDIFGRRPIALASTVLVIVGSIIMGTAHSFGQAVVAMTLCGIGAGIAELSALAGITEVVPIRARGYSVAIMTAIATPLGPYVLYCQLLATRATWRWGFWIVCIYQGIALVGVALLYFPSKHSRLVGLRRRDIIRDIDYIGGLLSLAGLTLLLVALQNGGYLHPWKSAAVLAPLITGIFALVAFVVWEMRFAKVPIAPPELFRRRVIRMAFIISFIAGMNFYSLTNFAPTYFSSVYPADPILVGGRGAGFVTAATVVAGFAVGGLIVPAATIATIACPDDMIATTAALTLAIRAIGGSIGFTIYYNIFVNKLDAKLPAEIATYAIQAGLPVDSATEFVTALLTNPASLTSVNGVNSTIIAAGALGSQWAFADSLKYIFYTSIPFGVLAIVAAFFLGDIVPYMTNRIVATLNH